MQRTDARGQLERLRHGTSGAPGGLLDLGFDFHLGGDNNGLLLRLIDYRDRSRDVQFSYDEYYRLVAAETAGAHWGLAWSYDAWGNRVEQAVTKGTAPAQATAVDPATNRVVGWSYDAAGNVLSDGQHTYTWDAENRLVAVDGAVTYGYDGRGRRVLEVTGGEVTYFVLGMGEYTPGVGWKRRFVYLGREKLVEYSGGTTWFYHPDHLGTPRVKADVAGGEVARWEYYPYGERAGGPAERHGFTGHWEEAGGGLVFAGRRYYAAAAGRWLSADPVAGDPARPWTLNRYAYAWNDPVNYLDPDGGEPITGPHTSITVTGEYTGVSTEESGVGGLPPRERGQGGGGGGPAGAPTGSGAGSTQEFVGVRFDPYQLLEWALDRWISEDCLRLFSQIKGSAPVVLESIVAHRDLEFVDMTDPANWNRRLDEVFPGMPGTFPRVSAGAAAILALRNQRGEIVKVSSTILLYESFWSAPARYQGIALVHEMLHYTSKLSDIDLANTLRLSFSGGSIAERELTASRAIRSFLMSGCQR